MTYLLMQTFLLLLSAYFFGAFVACVVKRWLQGAAAGYASQPALAGAQGAPSMARSAERGVERDFVDRPPMAPRLAPEPAIPPPAPRPPVREPRVERQPAPPPPPAFKPRSFEPVQPKIDILPRPAPRPAPKVADVMRFDRALWGPELNENMPRVAICEIRPAVFKLVTGPALPWPPKKTAFEIGAEEAAAATAAAAIAAAEIEQQSAAAAAAKQAAAKALAPPAPARAPGMSSALASAAAAAIAAAKSAAASIAPPQAEAPKEKEHEPRVKDAVANSAVKADVTKPEPSSSATPEPDLVKGPDVVKKTDAAKSAVAAEPKKPEPAKETGSAIKDSLPSPSTPNPAPAPAVTVKSEAANPAPSPTPTPGPAQPVTNSTGAALAAAAAAAMTAATTAAAAAAAAAKAATSSVAKPVEPAAAPISDGDDLQRIRAIDAKAEQGLKSLGVLRFEDIANWTSDDIDLFDQELNFAGRIDREQWIEQAQILAKGGETYYSRNRATAAKATAATPAATASPAVSASAPASSSAPVTAKTDAAKIETAPAAGTPIAADAGAPASVSAVPVPVPAPATVAVTPTPTPPEPAKPVSSPTPAPPSPDAKAASSNPPAVVPPDVVPAPKPPAPLGRSVSELASAAAAAIAAASASVTRGIRPIEPISPLSKADPNLVMPTRLADAIKEQGGKVQGGKDKSANDAVPVQRSDPEQPVAKASAPRAADDAGGDDLKRIRGVGVLIEKRLNGLGVTRYDHIANWTSGDIDRISRKLDFQGRIERENWVEQARILSSGGHTEFSRRVDRGEVETSKDS